MTLKLTFLLSVSPNEYLKIYSFQDFYYLLMTDTGLSVSSKKNPVSKKY